jgi:hypothetical protein
VELRQPLGLRTKPGLLGRSVAIRRLARLRSQAAAQVGRSTSQALWERDAGLLNGQYETISTLGMSADLRFVQAMPQAQ